jgi:PmbA protein
MSKELLESAKAAVALGKKHGASDVAATTTRSRSVETTWRDGKIEKVADATSRSLSLAIYADGRYGSMSTSDLRPQALDRFVSDAVAMVKAIAKDPHRRLPDPALYAGRSEADLEIFDPALVDPPAEARLSRVRAMEEAARSGPAKERIVSVTSWFSHSDSETARVASNGFEGAYRGTYASQSAEVSMKDDDDRRPEDWAEASSRHIKGLPSPEAIGREATERTAARLGAKKIASGTMNVLVEARAARGLLRHLLSPLWGGALQQKESFLEGKLDKEIASPVLTVTDEPLLRRGLASRPFDSEGMSARSRVLFDHGKLRSYLLDVYYANKLGASPTTGRTSNVVLAPGTMSREALLRDMKSGILVTGFLGGNSNATTGAFSLGLVGFRVAGGERREPVSEMNLGGTHLAFWKKLAAAGDDLYAWSSTRTPSLLFRGVSVAGK